MKNSSYLKTITNSTTRRPFPKLEDFLLQNPSLKSRPNPESSHGVKGLQSFSFAIEHEVIRPKRKSDAVTKPPCLQLSSNRGSKRGSFAVRHNTEGDQASLDPLIRFSKNNDGLNFRIVTPNRPNIEVKQQKSQASTSNSSQPSTNNESEIEGINKKNEGSKHVSAEVTRKNTHLRVPSTCKAASNTGKTEEILSMHEKKACEIQTPSRIQAISVEKREALRAFALKKESMMPQKKNEEPAEESHRTLTSAFNSNKTIGCLTEPCWDDTEDPEKLIKEVVEKHVEEAYKNIGLIKNNFHRKSKTYMFYIYKDE